MENVNFGDSLPFVTTVTSYNPLFSLSILMSTKIERINENLDPPLSFV